jgi:hypothetical protein
LPLRVAVGVGQSENPRPRVARADFDAFDDASCNAETQLLKVADDAVETEGEMAAHVFDEDAARLHLADDVLDRGPQMARVSRALAVAGRREWLARISGSEDIHLSAPGAAVESFDVVPDRGVVDRSVAHARLEDFDRERVALDIADGTVSRIGDVESEFEAGSTGT